MYNIENFRFFLLLDLWRLWCSIKKFRPRLCVYINVVEIEIYGTTIKFQLFDNYSDRVRGFKNDLIDWNTFMTYEIIYNLYMEIIKY